MWGTYGKFTALSADLLPHTKYCKYERAICPSVGKDSLALMLCVPSQSGRAANRLSSSTIRHPLMAFETPVFRPRPFLQEFYVKQACGHRNGTQSARQHDDFALRIRKSCITFSDFVNKGLRTG